MQNLSGRKISKFPHCESCMTFSPPIFLDCNCDPQGTTEEICNDYSGECICKEGFGGARCDQCKPGYFNFPNCEPCACSEVGSTSEICEVTDGQCPCKRNYGGRQCDVCTPGFYGYPDCLSKCFPNAIV